MKTSPSGAGRLDIMRLDPVVKPAEDVPARHGQRDRPAEPPAQGHMQRGHRGTGSLTRLDETVKEQVAGVGVNGPIGLPLVVTVPDAQNLVNVPAKHSQPEEVEIVFPCRRLGLELVFGLGDCLSHVVGPRIKQGCESSRIQTLEAGTAPRHGKVEPERIDPGQSCRRQPLEFFQLVRGRGS